MINYIEKGQGLHSAITEAGHWLMQVDGQWESSDDVAVQAIIDSYDPLPKVQQAMWNAIQAERENRKLQGLPIAGKRYHSDADSRIQQLGLAMLGASIPAGLQWKTMDGSFVEMTPTLAQQIFGGGNVGQVIFAIGGGQFQSVTVCHRLTTFLAQTLSRRMDWPSKSVGSIFMGRLL